MPKNEKRRETQEPCKNKTDQDQRSSEKKIIYRKWNIKSERKKKRIYKCRSNIERYLEFLVGGS